jgi:CHAT domain-containing protein
MRQLAEDVLEQARVSEDEQYKTLIPALEDQLTRAEDMYQETRSTLQQQYPQMLPLLEGTGGILDAASVQQELQRLDEPTTLVAYYVIDERVEEDAPALAFVIDAETPGVTAIALPDATSVGLSRPVNNLATWYADPSRGDPPEAAFQELHAALIQPVRDAGVLSTTQLGIVPHQELHYVPFAALNNGSEYLIEQHALFVLPSASALKLSNDALALQAPPGDPVALIYGDPTSDRPVLSNAAAEAEAIAHMLDSTAYTRDDATEQRLRTQADDAHLVHLAALAHFCCTQRKVAKWVDFLTRVCTVLRQSPASRAFGLQNSAGWMFPGEPDYQKEVHVLLSCTLVHDGACSPGMYQLQQK